MSQRRKAVLSLVSLLTFGVVSMLAGCGHSGGSTPAPSVVASGKVVMGTVSGAKVCADLNANKQCDTNEPFDITDADGNFNFNVLASSGTAYNLLSVGGTDNLTGKAAPTLEAPSDARNITQATDLVAKSSNPAATKAMLNALTDGKYDADVSASAGVSSALMKIVKSIETTRDTFAQILGVTEPAQLNALIQAIADAMTASPDTNIDTLIADSFAAATTTTVTTLVNNGSLLLTNGSADIPTVAALVSDSVAQVTLAVGSAPTVVEDSALQSAIETGVASVDTTPVTSILAKVAFTLSDLKAYDANGVRIDSIDGSGNYTIPDSVTEISVAVVARNDFGTAMPYTVQIKLSINDINSGRLANFTFFGVELGVAAGPPTNALVTLVTSATSTMTVEAWKSDGTQIVTNPVNGPFALTIDATNEVFLDLASIENILSTQVSAEFASLSLPGSYNLTLQMTGAPAVSMAEPVLVVPVP